MGIEAAAAPRSFPAESVVGASDMGTENGQSSERKPELLDPRRGTDLLPTYHKKLKPEERRLAYYKTEAQCEWVDRSKFKRSSTVRALHDKVFYKKSCANEQGHRASTQLPVYKTQFCNYNRDFTPKDLGNAPLDRKLAAAAAEAATSGGQLGPPQSLRSETTHKALYTRHVKDGRGESCKPIREVHTSPFDKLLETRPVSHRHFPEHDRRFAERLRGELMPLGKFNSCTTLPLVPTRSEHGLEYR